MEKKNAIPSGTTDYYGKDAKLRDCVMKKIEKIYKRYGFEPLYTPLFENAVVFQGHHGDGEKLLFKLEDKNNEKYVLKYDSTVPLARVISMYDIKMPYKRYQLQQSYRDDEIDKGHFREFIQCDGDIVGSTSLVNDAEFVCISYDTLKDMGFNDFTIRLNHRKIFKAIAEKMNITSNEGLLEIQRAIDMADKINKGNISDVRQELIKANINEDIVEIVIDIISISNNSSNIVEALTKTEEYFNYNQNAVDASNELKTIISYLPHEVLEKVKIDFTLARGADYYTGFIIEADINKIRLVAVLGGGRYDELVVAFSEEKVPAVGLAFGLERIIVALKELGLEKYLLTSPEKRILLYVDKNQEQQALQIAKYLREKHDVSLVFADDMGITALKDYSLEGDFTLVARINGDGEYTLDKPEELSNDLIKTKRLSPECQNK